VAEIGDRGQCGLGRSDPFWGSQTEKAVFVLTVFPFGPLCLCCD
jgi:hypothetical protein